jgi:small subunit ribosomal protein S21
MATVNAHPKEPFEKLLRRFRKSVEAAGIIKDAKRKEYYLKPSEAKKKKKLDAEKRKRRAEARLLRRKKKGW